MEVIIEERSQVEAGGVVTLHSQGARLEDMASLPQPGALVHVLVQPLVSHWQVELLDEKGEVGVEGSEEGEGPLEELNRHKVVREVAELEIIHPFAEERVEAINRVCGRSLHQSLREKKRGA